MISGVKSFVKMSSGNRLEICLAGFVDTLLQCQYHSHNKLNVYFGDALSGRHYIKGAKVAV